jgi:hypothetical protein
MSDILATPSSRTPSIRGFGIPVREWRAYAVFVNRQQSQMRL